MNFIKTSIVSILLLFFMASFSNCSSTKQTNNQSNDQANKTAMQNFQEKPSFTLGETSFKYWVAGVQGGGSGITLLISMENNKNNVVLDSAYFRGMSSKFEAHKTGYVANLITEANQKEDLIMSTNKNAEYGNEMPVKATFPFPLKDYECVISYLEDNSNKYYKIENLVEKPRDQYPSVAPKN